MLSRNGGGRIRKLKCMGKENKCKKYRKQMNKMERGKMSKWLAATQFIPLFSY
jgi:hypothetical protein